MTDVLKEEAQREAAEAWGCPVEDVYADDVTEAFGWVRRHTVFMLSDVARRRTLAAARVGAPCLVFNLGREENLVSLNTLLRDEGVRLPFGLPLTQLADVVHDFTLHPTGLAASKQFCEEQEERLDLWTGGAPGKAGLFRRYCQDPSVELKGGGWQLTFFYLTGVGGVERWVASGDESAVREAAAEVVLPNGTFFFPFA
jgi:hypothetical protein